MHDYLNNAISALHEGKLIAMPTETVYGLAAPYNNPDLVKQIFTLKQRPLFDPLILHVSDLKQVKALVKTWTPTMQALAEAFWPGPLTMVVEKSDAVSDLISSGLSTVGIRMPQHPLALELISRLDTPLAAPSANLFGKTSPTKAEDVAEFFSPSDVFILDGGPCKVGIESTIIGVEGLHLTFYRPGMISQKEICAKLPDFSFTFTNYSLEKVVAPGLVKHHYMPKIPIYYKTLNTDKNQILQLIQSDFLKADVNIGMLLLDHDPNFAARQLYGSMRQLSSKNDCILFEELEIHQSEIWSGIIDRLKRASSQLI